MAISTDEEKQKQQRMMVAGAVVAIIICAILGVFLFKDMIFSAPTVTVESAVLTDITLQETTITLNLLVCNRNPLGATVTDMDIDLFWNYKGESYNIANVKKDKFTIDANGNTTIPVPVKFKNTQMLPLVYAAAVEDTFDISAKGNFDTQILFVKMNVPVDEDIVVQNTMKDQFAATLQKVMGMIDMFTSGDMGAAGDSGSSAGGLFDTIMTKVKEYVNK
ncbi:MAG: LEA type 2 family protein [Methanomicrobium sp.]|nr:LEA type 2 family protein [Methanomicrobium sp.]